MIVLRVLLQTVVLALTQIWANKARAFLTALGIIIGVGSVTAVIAGLTGMKQWVLKEFETFGVKRVFIDGTLPDELENRFSWLDVQLTLDEVEAIREHCPSISKIAPMWYGGYEVQNAETVQQVGTWGIMPQWHEVTQRWVESGRPITSLDIDEQLQVCLINEQAVIDLKLDRNPVGSTLLIADRMFEIIGVVETKDLSQMFGGGQSRTEIYIPFSTAQLLNPFGWINYAEAELTSPDQAHDVEPEIDFVLRKLRNLEPDDPDTHQVHIAQEFIEQFQGIAAGITAVAGGIVGISLLVGGVGIMNIMLVSVSERTREIGLRKAMGARPSIILLQFLTEAVVLCLAGGAVGLVIGQAITVLVTAIPGSPLTEAEIPPWAFVLAFGFSAGVGVIFGMWPAVKASRLDPIEALRHE